MSQQSAVKCKGAGGIIIVDNPTHGQLMLVVKGPEKWSVPKGHIETCERPYQCAQREILEETGLSVNLKKCQPFRKFKKYWYYLISLDAPKVCRAQNINEIREIKWCTLSELKKMYDQCNRPLNYIVERWEELFGGT